MNKLQTYQEDSDMLATDLNLQKLVLTAAVLYLSILFCGGKSFEEKPVYVRG